MEGENIKDDLNNWLSNREQEAAKKGNIDLAFKLKLAKTHFNDCDPKNTCEQYINAKQNCDPVNASKNLSILFEPLYCQLSHLPQICNELKLTSTINQLREELSILLSELKSNNLKLKASSAPASIASRQNASVNPSPMLSPRLKTTPDDHRHSNRDSAKSFEGHLHSSSRIIFYNQLFEHLPQVTRRNILCHFIDHSENQFEACRLIMLGFVLMGSEFKNYAKQLLQTLIELGDPKKHQITKTTLTEDKTPQIISNPRQLMMCRYARSLLVLDAIPLTLEYLDISAPDFDINELFEQVLRLYSDQCLETSSHEHELSELHEGVKKTIAGKILGIEMHVAARDPCEDIISQTLSQLSLKVIEEIIDPEWSIKLTNLRSIINTKQDHSCDTKDIIDLINTMNLNGLNEEKYDPSLIVTTPPKTRGRPKKKQTSNVNLDEGVGSVVSAQTKSAKYMPTRIVFFSLVEFMFNKCLSYLRSTKSRMLINIDIDEDKVEPEISHANATLDLSQRSSRSKNSNPVNVGPSPAKVQKTSNYYKPEAPIRNGCRFRYQSIENSPLNCDQSRIMDQQLINHLKQAKEILDYLNSDELSLSPIWNKFMETYKLNELSWFQKIEVDSCIMSSQHKEAAEILLAAIDHEADSKYQTSTSTSDLRRLTQLISCHVQLSQTTETLATIDKLLSTMKTSELLLPDENYSNGNIIMEYIIDIDGKLVFLFLDTLSILRFCVDILIELLENHIKAPKLVSDVAIGHTIVLSQFDWPKEVGIYSRCIDWIRANKPKSTTPQYLSASTKFTYPEFFHFVRNPNIIEDFMALLCQSYTLDVKDSSGTKGVSSSINATSTGNTPSKSGSRSTKAITTRGVNKTFKEDLKVALIAQMKCSTVLVTLDMISEFIRMSVLPFLKSVYW